MSDVGEAPAEYEFVYRASPAALDLRAFRSSAPQTTETVPWGPTRPNPISESIQGDAGQREGPKCARRRVKRRKLVSRATVSRKAPRETLQTCGILHRSRHPIFCMSTRIDSKLGMWRTPFRLLSPNAVPSRAFAALGVSEESGLTRQSLFQFVKHDSHRFPPLSGVVAVSASQAVMCTPPLKTKSIARTR